jgi:hypothetical protein
MTERSLAIIDGTLHLLEGDEVIHVFENSRPRAAYKHMCDWASSNFASKFSGDPETFWAEAERSWTCLSPEVQGLLLTLQVKEEQMVKDIRLGLLATLASYQGTKTVKERFAKAIRGVEL